MPSRLLVVSNRAPVEVQRAPTGQKIKRTVGGLATALDDALRSQGGTWIAWAGAVTDDRLTPEVTGLSYPIRAVRLITSRMAEAVNEGRGALAKEAEEAPAASDLPVVSEEEMAAPAEASA